MPPAAGGFAPNPPASGSWGLRPHTPIGLRWLGAPPPDPPNSPLHCEFLATRLTAAATKSYYVVSALDQDTAQRLIYLLNNPPEDNKYTTLKERLLDTFELSEYERAACLLNMPNLGDRKPSALMDEMLGLLGQHTPCLPFKYIFLQHLPKDSRTILAAETFDNWRSLAQRGLHLVDGSWGRTNNRSNSACERGVQGVHRTRARA